MEHYTSSIEGGHVSLFSPMVIHDHLRISPKAAHPLNFSPPPSLSPPQSSLMASLSSTLRFFSPKPSLPFSKPSPSPTPSLSFSSPISFQPLSQLSPPHRPPIKSQQSQSQQTLTLALPPNLQRIVALFQSVPDPKSKYQQLLHYGTQLPPYPPRLQTDAYRVRGCVSRVWVRAYPDPDDPSKVRFDADSDSALTKGLAALLVIGLSGESPDVVTGVSPEFVQLLGLRQSLSPSRNNGFLNMLKLMQEKAAEVGGLARLDGQDGVLKEGEGGLGRENGGFGGNLKLDDVSVANGEEIEEENEVLEREMGEGVEVSGVGGGRKERMRERLERELNPTELEIEDVSHMHAGHAGVRGNTSGETHFNLRIVSKEFEGKSMVKRHRLVYDLLKEELESGLHALSIVAKTPSEV